MKKLIIGGILFTVALLIAVYVNISGDVMGKGDMVNIYSAIAAVVIVSVSVAVVLKYVNQMQNDSASGEDSGHEWDGIREYKNPIPTGWGIMFVALIVWFIYYLLVKYPVGGYSQIGEYNEEVAAHKAKFEKTWANLDDAKLKEMGESVFLVNCAPCHGALGDGMSGKAEDLTKRAFTKSYVKHVATHGSSQLGFGFMPDRNGLFNANTGAPITDAEIDAVASYVSNGFTGEGADVFAGACSSCHGDGSGIAAVGPNLKAYNVEFVSALLHNGSKKGEIGKMPAFKGRLTDTQVKAVATYVEKITQ